MNKWCEKEISEVILEIASRNKPEDVCELFDIVLTPREINDMARRFKIIEMLELGKSYDEIINGLGVSRNTISRVAGKVGFGFRRVHSTVAKKSGTKWEDPLLKRRNIYYKGVPSPGTAIRQLRNNSSPKSN